MGLRRLKDEFPHVALGRRASSALALSARHNRLAPPACSLMDRALLTTSTRRLARPIREETGRSCARRGDHHRRHPRPGGRRCASPTGIVLMRAGRREEGAGEAIYRRPADPCSRQRVLLRFQRGGGRGSARAGGTTGSGTFAAPGPARGGGRDGLRAPRRRSGWRRPASACPASSRARFLGVGRSRPRCGAGARRAGSGAHPVEAYRPTRAGRSEATSNPAEVLVFRAAPGRH